MKKSVFILVALFFISTLVWFSCKKGGVVSSKPTSTTDPLSTIDIGTWHNTVLSALATANNKTQTFSVIAKTESYSDLREKIIQILIKKDPSTFVESDIRSKAAIFDQISIDAQIKLLGNPGQSFDKLSIILDYLVTNKLISVSLGTEFEKIHNLTNQGVDGKVILKAVNDLKLQNFANNDQKYLNAFVSVYNSSYSFWNNRTNSSTQTTQSLVINVAASPCSTAVIAADAAGALYGLIGGPAWSIIEGAIFSALVDNSDICNNGA